VKNVKIGIIGLGFMGTTHLGIYRKLPGVQVTAITDSIPQSEAADNKRCRMQHRRDGQLEKAGLERISVHEDALEMIRKSDTDIIDICVPTPEHKKYILESLKAGKHVFSENPCAVTCPR
jgi:predicted dehydrogenase